MAVVCNLTDGTTTVDFTTASGFELLEEYVPKVATPPGDGTIPPYIMEVLPCRVVAHSDDALATELQNLAALQKRAAQYWRDEQEATPVWFHMKLDDETNERRAFVKSISLTPNENWFLDQATGTHGFWYPVNVTIERHPYWESTASVSFGAVTPSAAASVIWDHTAAADIVGDVPGRLAYNNIRGNTNNLGRLWMGFRSANKHGTVGNFVNIWECEDTDCVLGTDAARGTGADASPGAAPPTNTKVVVTPGTATPMTKRLTMDLNDFTANESDNYGQYLWLLRACCGSIATTWEVQLRVGASGMWASEFIQGDTQTIAQTGWEFLHMGVFNISQRNTQAIPTSVLHEDMDSLWRIEIWAQRTAGTGTLELDCLCPIPLDEGFCYIETNTINGFILYWGESPKDVAQVLFYVTGTGHSGPAKFDRSSFRLPVGDGRMVICYAENNQTVLANTLTISSGGSSFYYPRWLSLRGTE